MESKQDGRRENVAFFFFFYLLLNSSSVAEQTGDGVRLRQMQASYHDTEDEQTSSGLSFIGK